MAAASPAAAVRATLKARVSPAARSPLPVAAGATTSVANTAAAAVASARAASIAADLGLDETSFDDGSVDFNDSVDDSFLFPENSNKNK